MCPIDVHIIVFPMVFNITDFLLKIRIKLGCNKYFNLNFILTHTITFKQQEMKSYIQSLIL